MDPRPSATQQAMLNAPQQKTVQATEVSRPLQPGPDRVDVMLQYQVLYGSLPGKHLVRAPEAIPGHVHSEQRFSDLIPGRCCAPVTVQHHLLKIRQGYINDMLVSIALHFARDVKRLWFCRLLKSGCRPRGLRNVQRHCHVVCNSVGVMVGIAQPETRGHNMGA